MRILLTNDDGVNAAGLKVLERIARTCPTTLDRRAPLRSNRRWSLADADQAGSAAAARRAALLRHRHADRLGHDGDRAHHEGSAARLILSGVNRGANLGEDVTYSGTVSAAMEGALAGIPSIALSQSYAKEGMGDTVPFAAAEAWGVKVLRPIVESPMEPRTLVNINFPALSSRGCEGRAGHAAGPARYGRLRIVQRTDPRGYDYFWFGSGRCWKRPATRPTLKPVRTATSPSPRST
jgi:5'-nucleotidase